MLPSVVPRLTTDLAVRVFPGAWKLLSFKTPFLGWSSVLGREFLKERSFQTPGDTLTAESVMSLGTTEGNITGRKNK